METRSLAVKRTTSDLICSISDLLQISETLLKSGLLPNTVKTKETACAIILKGREVGFAAMESFEEINVVQGKPTVSPKGMLALIYGSRELEAFDARPTPDNKAYRCVMKRRGLNEHSEIFTMDDAVRMGLADKDNWKKQPLTMLKWRAISACARVVFPDVIAGMYLPEEMGANVNDDGEIIEAQPVVPKSELVQAQSVAQATNDYDMPARLEHLKAVRAEVKAKGGAVAPIKPSDIATPDGLEQEISMAQCELDRLNLAAQAVGK